MLPPAPVTITRAAFDQAADDVHVQLHRRAAQEVADFNVADGDAVVAAQAVLDGTDDLQFQPRLLAGVHQVPQARAGQGARRDQHGAGGAGRGDFAHVFQAAQDRNLPQPRADGAVFRGQKAAHAVGQFTTGLDLVGQQPRGVVGSHQQGPAEVAGIEDRPELLAIQPPRAAQRAEHGDRAQAIDDDHRMWIAQTHDHPTREAQILEILGRLEERNQGFRNTLTLHR